MRSYSAAEWARVRESGKPVFLFRAGLARGLPFGLILSVAVEVMRGGEFPEALSEPAFLIRTVLAVAVFTLSGSLRANVNWQVHERRYGGESDGHDDRRAS